MTSEVAKGAHYDLVVLDAFSSDSVPTHLLTTEALNTALSLLTPHGVLVAHVSSRFFRLPPLLSAAARALGVAALLGNSDETKNDAEGIHFSSTWVALARQDADLAPLRQQRNWGPLPPAPHNFRPWTDDYSNLWQVMILPGSTSGLPDTPKAR